MTVNQQIDCALHDYIEIACLYQYKLSITLNDNQVMEGIARDIITAADKRETLVLHNPGEQTVNLTDIRHLTVLTPGARFKEIDFKTGKTHG